MLVWQGFLCGIATQAERWHMEGMAKTPKILHQRHPPHVWEMLDRIRKAEPDLPTESEMVRRLIERRAREVDASAPPGGQHATRDDPQEGRG